MPQFLINARDKAGALELRMANRPAHLEWLKAHAEKILMVGPVFADDGETFAGSALVVEFETLHEAENWAARDPYAQAGLFQSVEIMPFKWVMGSGKP
ncbi:YciI family protein [Henriciella sp. AS95]|uniref:YciI family protein n=1 Tax=Henriciella sp. AS95 TaxID=3135782 RepID=UPI0031755DD6